MAVGVVLAFAWNMTVSQPQAAETGSGVTPQVGLTVEDAAAQAWASVTPRAAAQAWASAAPRAAASSSPRSAAVRTPPRG